MAALGHERFAVVGHDRGARVGFRLALDHPDRVTCVALLKIVPTVDQFERMGAGPSLGYWPWFLLAQPAPFPERLIAADPGGLLDYIFESWPTNPDAIGPESRDAYRQAMPRKAARGLGELARRLLGDEVTAGQPGCAEICRPRGAGS